jgi:hypothetical protein
MNKVTIGALLCLSALILLHRQQIIFGMLAFIYGIILMYNGKWPRR